MIKNIVQVIIYIVYSTLIVVSFISLNNKQYTNSKINNNSNMNNNNSNNNTEKAKTTPVIVKPVTVETTLGTIRLL